MGEGNGFKKDEPTARTKRVEQLEHGEHRQKMLTWIIGILTGALSLVGAGWTAKTYMGHVATAAEVEKLKVSATADRERMAAIEQAHQDDREWRALLDQKVTHVQQQIDKLLDLALGRARRSDGR